MVFSVSDDDADVLGIQGGGGVDNALDHGLAADAVQHFGHFGIHARAFAGGEDDDVEGCCGHGILSADGISLDGQRPSENGLRFSDGLYRNTEGG